MGKDFPIIKRLSEVPTCLAKTLDLIERSFKYEAQNHFSEDFAPLMEEANLENCFVLLGDGEEVLAHVGSKVRLLDISGKKHPVCFLGGIAVAEHARGQGYLQALLTEAMAHKKEESALFMLWSDLDKLYAKFGFFQAGAQYEAPANADERKFEQTKFHLLSSADRTHIEALYAERFAQNYVTCVRTKSDWVALAMVTSADLFLRRAGAEITGYFFMNKGQDLPGVIYEYACRGNETEFLNEIRAYGKVWMGAPRIDYQQLYFQFLLGPGNTKLLSALVEDLTDGRVRIRELNQIKREVFFEFDGELLGLDLEEFFCGVFGPTYFEEVPLGFRPVFISGLDSI